MVCNVLKWSGLEIFHNLKIMVNPPSTTLLVHKVGVKLKFAEPISSNFWPQDKNGLFYAAFKCPFWFAFYYLLNYLLLLFIKDSFCSKNWIYFSVKLNLGLEGAHPGLPKCWLLLRVASVCLCSYTGSKLNSSITNKLPPLILLLIN